MPDVSVLVDQVIKSAQETVTLPNPSDAVVVDVAVEQGESVTVQSNPQEQTEPKLEELSTTNPQEELRRNKTFQCNAVGCMGSFDDEQQLMTHMKTHETIEKIECDRCHKILNSKDEVGAHNLEFHNGRPCSFCEHKDEIMKKTNEFIEKAKSKDKPFIPYEEDLAIFYLDVDEDTITNWKNKTIGDTKELEHPEFFGAIKKLLTLQKLYLLKRTIGRYNPTGSIFQLKVNHGMMETEKKILAGSDKSGEELVIKVVEEKPTLKHE